MAICQSTVSKSKSKPVSSDPTDPTDLSDPSDPSDYDNDHDDDNDNANEYEIRMTTINH